LQPFFEAATFFTGNQFDLPHFHHPEEKKQPLNPGIMLKKSAFFILLAILSFSPVTSAISAELQQGGTQEADTTAQEADTTAWETTEEVSVDLSTPGASLKTHLYFLHPENYEPDQAAQAFLHPELTLEEARDAAIKLKQILDGRGYAIDPDEAPEILTIQIPCTMNTGTPRPIICRKYT